MLDQLRNHYSTHFEETLIVMSYSLLKLAGSVESPTKFNIKYTVCDERQPNAMLPLAYLGKK